jgi:MscS family membrane protein
MAASSTEHNLSGTALQDVTNASKEMLQSLDQSIFAQIQPYINKLYASPYGRYLADTIFGIPLGNLIAAILVFLFVVILRKYLTKIVTRLLLNLAKKTETQLDDIIVNQLKSPIRFLFVIIALDLFFQFTFLNNQFTQLLLSSLLIFDVYWMLYAFTPAIHHFLINYSRHNEHISYELSRFIVRIIRLLVILLGIISLLYNFGINVTAFVASLGLVGMAFALAAKDTAANLFGSIALMLDQSIRIGEWIKVNGVEGIVEDIGMRTTKIRTFEKSFVVVPNSIVANTNIENFSRRGIRRIKMVIGLTYDTTTAQMQKITYDLRSMLTAHEGIAHDQTLLIRFARFEDSYLGIFVYAFTNTSDWARYLEIKEDINLKIMEIVEENGASFAFPSQSIYVEKLPLSMERSLPEEEA